MKKIYLERSVIDGIECDGKPLKVLDPRGYRKNTNTIFTTIHSGALVSRKNPPRR